MAFLAPDEIAREVLASAGIEEFDEAVAALRRYSLISLGSDTILVHRLVQAVTRASLARAGEEARWAERALTVLNAAFPYQEDKPATWAASDRLVPHGLAAIEHAGRLQVGMDSVSTVLNDLGLFFLNCRVQLRDARGLMERSLAIAEGLWRPDHAEVAVRANNLGQILKAHGDFAGGPPVHRARPRH